MILISENVVCLMFVAGAMDQVNQGFLDWRLSQDLQDPEVTAELQ